MAIASIRSKILWMVAAATLPVAVDANLVGTHTTTPAVQPQQQQQTVVAVASTASGNIHGCSSSKKKITLTRFCIGDHDSFEEFTTHEFYLNGFLATPQGQSFARGECHELSSNNGKITDPTETLTVGLRDSDDFHDESMSYKLPPAYWHINDSCETYEILLSRTNTGDHEWTGCWQQEQQQPATGVDDPSSSNNSTELIRCEEGWEHPDDAFVWYLRVDPDDGTLPVGGGISNPSDIEDPSIWFGDEEKESQPNGSNSSNGLRGSGIEQKQEDHGRMVIAETVILVFLVLAIIGGCYKNYTRRQLVDCLLRAILCGWCCGYDSY